jgi:pyruvyltransferase
MLKLFWFSRLHFKRDNVTNFGDELSKELIEKISGEKITWVNPQKQNLYDRYFTKNILGIGSILHFSAKNSLVWGSGLIKTDSFASNCQYFAVRGKYTRNELVSRGYKVPEVFGDPGLLTPKIFPKTIGTASKKIGIIPHYVEYDYVKEKLLNNEKSDELIVIDLRENIEMVLNQMMSCEYILSSSLHGIIVPQAYNIKTLRVSFTEKIYGDGIKYLDYFDSVKIEPYELLNINESNFNMRTFENFIKKFEKFSHPNIDIVNIQDKLLAVKPF